LVRAWFVALVGLVSLAGCQSPANAPAPAFHLNQDKSVEITPADAEFEQRRASTKSSATRRSNRTASQSGSGEMTERELYELPKFSVSQKGFRKLGLSVVTNTEVAVGGAIEWMRVGVVLPGSPAARQGLFTGIEILAIDNVPIAQLSREEMLHLLFEREAGEQVRLLVYSRQFGPLPRFVAL
jgi:C-terminal processing protease CtpA/Prc